MKNNLEEVNREITDAYRCREIIDAYRYEGFEHIEIVKSLDDYETHYLVRFEKDGKQYSSIALYFPVDGAEIIQTTFRKYEDDMVNDALDEIEREREYEITNVTEEEKEYEIQSDLDLENYFGKSVDDYADLLDNVDFGRWLDDHGGEMYEH